MSTELLDYNGLAAALMDSPALNDINRDRLIKDYAQEIGALMIALHRTGVVGEVFHQPDPAEQCALCEHDIASSGCYVDGKIAHAPGWVNMCWPCFLERGSGIGWGVGQLYRQDGSNWFCIAGGNPHPLEPM